MGTPARSARRSSLSSALRRFTPERLSPGYFAFVMGTGILSIGAAQRGWEWLSAALIVLAAVGYALLVVLNGWRLVAYRGAITIVAGSRIVEMESTPMVGAVRGLVAGVSVVLWCFATWLIPVLFAAGIWRHVLKKYPLRYTPTLWSIVFPLGMYAVAGMYLGRADQLPIVARIGELWTWVALAAWVATMLAMIGSWVSMIRREAVR